MTDTPRLCRARAGLATLRRLNIDFSVGFIMFQPMSTLAGIAENLAFLGENRIANYRRLTNRLELYPGAPLQLFYARQGVAFRSEGYRVHYDFADPLVSRLYAAMNRILAPFRQVEAACTAGKFHAARGHGDASATRLALLRGYSEQVSDCMIERAFRLLREVWNSGTAASFDSAVPIVAKQVSRLMAGLKQHGVSPDPPASGPKGGDGNEAS